MLRLRGRLAGLVLLLQQRGAARQPPGHRSTEQPAADSSRTRCRSREIPTASSWATPGWPCRLPIPRTGDPPTGDQSWTCFLSAANFKGPIAYYIPETWSKIGKLFNYPFLYGRGLDARPGIMGGGAMEINTVPRFDAKDAQGTTYSKLPKLQFPVDAEGRAFLVQDVTYYSKAALYDAFKAWRDGGPACSGRFDEKGAWKPKLNTAPRATTRAARRSPAWSASSTRGSSRAMCGACSGSPTTSAAKGLFPQYYKHAGDERVPVKPGRSARGNQA